MLLNSSFREKGILLWHAYVGAFSLRGIIESVCGGEKFGLAIFIASLCVSFTTKPFFFQIIMRLILLCWIGVLFCG